MDKRRADPLVRSPGRPDVNPLTVAISIENKG